MKNHIKETRGTPSTSCLCCHYQKAHIESSITDSNTKIPQVQSHNLEIASLQPTYALKIYKKGKFQVYVNYIQRTSEITILNPLLQRKKASIKSRKH